VGRVGRGEPRTVAVLQGFVANEGDAWRYTRDAIADFFDRVLARRTVLGEPPALPRSLVTLADEGVPKAAADLVGPYLEAATLLGRRTAELHLALASVPDDPAFAPEPFSTLYQRSIYQSQLTLIHNSLDLLRRRKGALGPRDREMAERLIAGEDELRRRTHAILDVKVTAARTRYHGDYHLGQVLWTGKDFVIIDFEGEPLRPLSERRIKRSPLRDVAGMIRSFQYAALFTLRNGGRVRPEDMAALEPWARVFAASASAAFLKAYLAAAAPGGFLPRTPEELRLLLEFYVLEKAAYELAYELNNRPGWAGIPLEGMLDLIE
jgi:maltose alpha-D-glucosyltransferase/alpha-amylase